jgi:hypothetical protein
MSMGKGFGDLAVERLRRDTDLDRIAGLLNWRPLDYRLEKHCRRQDGRPLDYRLEKHCRRQDGRPPFPPMTMFRALLLAQWYDLSDRDLEDALCATACRFAASSGSAWSRRRRIIRRCAGFGSG